MYKQFVRNTSCFCTTYVYTWQFFALFIFHEKVIKNILLFPYSGASNNAKKESPTSTKMEVDDFEVIEKFTEYLMYLEGEQPLEERKMDQKAEIIVVVDKSGSMGGTPWKQVQSALIKMLDITRGVNNCQAIGK